MVVWPETTATVREEVFTTGIVMSGDAQTFWLQTGRLILSKPYTPEQLTSAVREAPVKLEAQAGE